MTQMEEIVKLVLKGLPIDSLIEILSSENFTADQARIVLEHWYAEHPNYDASDDHVSEKEFEFCLVPPGEDLTDGWEHGMYEIYVPSPVPGVYLVYTRKGNSAQGFFHSVYRMPKEQYERMKE